MVLVYFISWSAVEWCVVIGPTLIHPISTFQAFSYLNKTCHTSSSASYPLWLSDLDQHWTQVSFVMQGMLIIWVLVLIPQVAQVLSLSNFELTITTWNWSNFAKTSFYQVCKSWKLVWTSWLSSRIIFGKYVESWIMGNNFVFTSKIVNISNRKHGYNNYVNRPSALMLDLLTIYRLLLSFLSPTFCSTEMLYVWFGLYSACQCDYSNTSHV